MRFLIFNITVVAALAYLIMNDGMPSSAGTVQELAHVAKVRVESMVSTVQQSVASKSKPKNNVAGKLTDQTAMATAPKKAPPPPPIVEVHSVKVVPVKEIQNPQYALQQKRQIEVQPAIPEKPKFMSNADRSRELMHLAESMEQMSFDKLSR